MINIFRSKKKKCPYCNIIIEKEHKSKFKCPSCKEEIMTVKDGEKIYYLTKAEHESHKAEKKKKADRNKYYRFYEDFESISQNYLSQKESEWFRKMGDKANYDDLTWSVANGLLHEFAKQNNFYEMKILYLKMASFQYQHGKDFFRLLQLCRKMELYQIRKDIGKDLKYKVVIVGSDPDCPECTKLDGTTYTIDEALEKIPIPHKDCTNGGWCRCCYSAEIVSSE